MLKKSLLQAFKSLLKLQHWFEICYEHIIKKKSGLEIFFENSKMLYKWHFPAQNLARLYSIHSIMLSEIFRGCCHFSDTAFKKWEKILFFQYFAVFIKISWTKTYRCCIDKQFGKTIPITQSFLVHPCQISSECYNLWGCHTQKSRKNTVFTALHCIFPYFLMTQSLVI